MIFAAVSISIFSQSEKAARRASIVSLGGGVSVR